MSYPFEWKGTLMMKAQTTNMSGHRLLSVGPRASHASHGGREIVHHEERQRQRLAAETTCSPLRMACHEV